LGESIRGFGANHFENADGSSGGWSYALPLLLAQQYRSALVHLADTGGPLGLLQATHLGLVMGEPLEDLGNVSSSSFPLLTSLLVELSNHLQYADAAAAIEYLIRIPDGGRKRSEVSYKDQQYLLARSGPLPSPHSPSTVFFRLLA
jgi:hypothetical protein